MTVYVNGNKGTVEGAKGILIKIRMEETNEVLLFHPHNTKIHTEDGCEISMPQQLELFSEVS